MKEKRTAINPTREQNYPEWYQEVIKAAELAEHAPVRGCMVIKPWGYAIWENIQRILDKQLKKRGYQNAYFPLFIPLSLLEKEAEHVEGFAKECAVITHHRLTKSKEGKLVPTSPLEEPLIVRPTSEVIIGEMFAKWVQSYRDLPLLINQWANVVRWEMRPRIFLRTTEFLWQEAHTAHATRAEAEGSTKEALGVYADFAQNVLAIPVVTGEKTPQERFPGAVGTYTIEAMMQDGKALQAGTSHFLGQSFAKAAGIQFKSAEGTDEHAWTTSWGMTTRMIGALVMCHSDDDGLVLPPRIAPAHVVIVPIIHKVENNDEILAYCQMLKERLSGATYFDRQVETLVDQREMRGGDKVWNWIKKGVPLRIEVGKREIDEGKISIALRSRGHRDYQQCALEDLVEVVPKLLGEVQKEIWEKALSFRDAHLHRFDSKEEIYAFFEREERGFVLAHWSGDPHIEKQIQEDLGVSIRCIPDSIPSKEGICPFTGKKSNRRVIYARSY